MFFSGVCVCVCHMIFLFPSQIYLHADDLYVFLSFLFSPLLIVVPAFVEIKAKALLHHCETWRSQCLRPQSLSSMWAACFVMVAFDFLMRYNFSPSFFLILSLFLSYSLSLSFFISLSTFELPPFFFLFIQCEIFRPMKQRGDRRVMACMYMWKVWVHWISLFP